MFKEYDNIEEAARMEFYVLKFIRSINNNTYNRIRQSESDAECRRYLKEQLKKQID